MDEQNQYPHDSQGEPDDNTQPQTPVGSGTAPDSSTADTSQSWFGDYAHPDQAQQGPEQTRPIPSYQQQPPTPWAPGYPPPSAPSKTSRGRGLTAAVLVGALVLGGAAGVGGSALFHAFNDDSSTGTTNTSSSPFQATKTTVVQDGTVEKVSQAVLPSVVKVNVSSSSGAGSGSGIILSKDGKILTNNHVVTGAGDNGTITVNFNDGTTKRAKVIGTDPVTDVAVIQAEDASDLTPAALGKLEQPEGRPDRGGRRVAVRPERDGDHRHRQRAEPARVGLAVGGADPAVARSASPSSSNSRDSRASRT